MKRIVPPLVLLLVAAMVSCKRGNDRDPRAGLAAAEAWIEVVDAGDYAASWRESAAHFKSAVDEAAWVAILEGSRKPMGGKVSREVESAEYRTGLPGAPAGDYVVVQFLTSFENRTGVIETVTPMREDDGVWRVSGYYIK